MRAAKRNDNNNPVLIDTKQLQAMVNSGRMVALKLGMAANARVQVGKRVLWNTQKVRDYINSISTGDNEYQDTLKEAITQ